MTDKIVHLPRPMTHDRSEIALGRMRAGQMYSDAKTDEERLRALIWVNHWRLLNEHEKALRQIGAA